MAVLTVNKRFVYSCRQEHEKSFEQSSVQGSRRDLCYRWSRSDVQHRAIVTYLEADHNDHFIKVASMK